LGSRRDHRDGGDFDDKRWVREAGDDVDGDRGRLATRAPDLLEGCETLLQRRALHERDPPVDADAAFWLALVLDLDAEDVCASPTDIEPLRELREALWQLALDAIDLFTGPLRQRVRTCAAEDCELLFVDASRPGRRRWCSMARCGSRAKMRRYRAP
jgi:predicted RNA-binding Zn ribbon-like protein